MTVLRKRLVSLTCVVALLLSMCVPSALVGALSTRTAWAADGLSSEVKDLDSHITVSAENDAAVWEGSDFGIADFDRMMVGSNRDMDGGYAGYCYYTGDTADHAVAVFTATDAIVYIPQSQIEATKFTYNNSTHLEVLGYLLQALDQATAKGGNIIVPDKLKWTILHDGQTEVTVKDVVYKFCQELKPGMFYTTVRGSDGSDVTASNNPMNPALDHADVFDLKKTDEIGIVQKATGLAALGEFLTTMDYSPLWVTLKTTGTAIVFIFILGLLAARWIVRLPSRAQDIFDAIFTIPMVLPPTVCGFILLLALGSNTPVGRWFIDIGFPLIFSWPATVIAAIVVAFPLMYRSTRGAFESLDPNMMDAARTLGWSEWKIFFKLMLPLSWSSIAAATVLAFARALGEFGATLFLAGNYVGVTQTIPIAIYFQWMNGNTDVAIFWTLIIIVFSFIVIMFINVWSKRTTKYRLKDTKEE